MLRILGNRKRLCNGLTRRELLTAGGLSVFGLGLSDFHRLRDAQATTTPQAAGANHFGQAKSCILLFLYGSPSQLELADQKPDAPVEVRGELGSIGSSLPGVQVCELLPNAAKVMDRMTIVRSMTHPYPIHGVAYATTGVEQIDVPMELNPHDPRHWPYIGSVVDYLERARHGGQLVNGMPNNLYLPWPFSSRREGEVPRAGPYAAFLGNAYNPIWTEFEGQATRTTTKTLQDRNLEVAEPYMGISQESHFRLAAGTGLPTGVTLNQLNERESLLQQLDAAMPAFEANAATQGMDQYRQMAYNLINSTRVHQALDTTREPIGLRDSYGMTLFGQASLTARRLVEAGCKFVTVMWDEFGLAGSGWDTHWQHYPRMRNELMPGFDMALHGLINDLDQRGILDETLVMVLSEHGRTPRLNNAAGGGRDHWSQAYTCLFAGHAGGSTDRIGGTVVDRPVSPKDILATCYHLLGIDPHTLLTDRTGRPFPLVQNARVVTEMLA